MTSSHPLPPPCQWFSRLASALDRRSAPRLARLFLGAVLARGRRTVTSWIRAAGLSDEFRPCYTTVAAAGKRADLIAARLAHEVVKPLVAGAGPADARPGRHPDRAVRAARPGGRRPPQPDPRPGRLAVRLRPRLGRPRAARPPPGVGRRRPAAAGPAVRPREGPAGIDPKHRPAFRTKLELAVELLRWAKTWLGLLGKPLWVVADGAYAKAPFLKPAGLGVTVVSRLRKDAALWTVPGPRAAAPPRPDRIYGERRIDLAKRAGQTRVGDRDVRPVPVDLHDDRGVGLEAGREGVDRASVREPVGQRARRPSHADKRRARRRELLGNEIRAVLRPGATEQELQAAAERMLQLAA